ncbi:hypothetical protein V5279_18940 [Bradyrhizobium sp. 26S5]|uniref:hypothetical protein n=1 Tax=Bradyrhizobium sp. 26S5 TaxID=3139729 RepID=UPI0030D40A9E
MGEIEIKRVNFFDGQFLRDVEFNELSDYMVHMRRRLLYVLFNKTGVVRAVGPDLKVEVPGQGVKKIVVRAGMALGRRDDLVEAKEIILREDLTIDLTVKSEQVPDPLQAGETGIVTVHYDEERIADPPSESDESKPTRIKEKAAIRVHRRESPLVDPDSKEPYVRLGTVALDTMQVADARQFTFLQKSLLADTPSITVVPNSVRAGDDLELTVGATDFDLSNPTMSVSLTSPPGGPAASNISVTKANVAASSITLKFKIPVTDPTGTWRLRVAVGDNGADAFLTVRAGMQLTGFEGVDQPAGNPIFKIKGAGFEEVMSVQFKDNSGQFMPELRIPTANVAVDQIVISKNDIPAAAMNGQVKVHSDKQEQTLDVILPPILTQVPFSGQRNHTIDIVGSRFVVGDTTVTFAGSATASPVASPAPTDQKFTVRVPNTATTGRIVVKTRGGAVQSDHDVTVTD